MIKIKPRNKHKSNVFLIFIGIIFIIWGIIIQSFSNFNIGYLLTVIMGLFFVIYGKFYDRINSIIPRPIKNLAKIGFILVLIWMLFLFIYGKMDTVDYKEDALVILGAGLRGEELSLNLRNRVDKGIE